MGDQQMDRLVVGITGASGAIFGARLLERLAEFPVETHVVVSDWGTRTHSLTRPATQPGI